MRKIGLFVFMLYCFTLVGAENVNHHYMENNSDLGIFMIYVEGGTYNMGNKKNKKREHDEENVHEVTLNDFFIGRTEVTVAQFAKFVKETNYKTDSEKNWGSYVWDDIHATMVFRNGVDWRFDESGDSLPISDYKYFPVVYVSWHDATEFCAWLSQKTGKIYTLPTEAEWEYAARGGNKSKSYVYSGSNKLENVAWFWNDSNVKLHPVANKLPNELGLFDMSGNAYEWCSDWYEDKYPMESQENPTGPVNEHKELFRRVIRGGSWVVFAEFCRVTNRDSGNPDLGTSTSGFRVVRRLK